jgi:hypothetical protein
MQISRAAAVALGHRLTGSGKRRPLLWRLVAANAFALLVVLAAVGNPLAEPSYPEPLHEWDNDWTVLPRAPDGAWGVATEMDVIRAIGSAVGDCRTRTAAEIGCGGQFLMFRAAWSLGVRCGDHNILIAEKNLDDAELRASWREYELRKIYVPDLPPCAVVVTVDPSGKIVPPGMSNSGQIYRWP